MRPKYCRVSPMVNSGKRANSCWIQNTYKNRSNFSLSRLITIFSLQWMNVRLSPKRGWKEGERFMGSFFSPEACNRLCCRECRWIDLRECLRRPRCDRGQGTFCPRCRREPWSCRIRWPPTSRICLERSDSFIRYSSTHWLHRERLKMSSLAHGAVSIIILS